MMRHPFHLAIFLAVVVAAPLDVAPVPLAAATNPIATPTGMVRYYFHALGSGQCDLAYKFSGPPFHSLSAFRSSCRSIRRIVIEQLDDPGYRLHPQTAAYTCLAVRYTIYRRSGATTFGGWYLMERTLGPAWHILFALSRIARDGSASLLSSAQCASHLPSYVHPGAGTIISGSAFRSVTAGWIALSTSGSYLPNGSCTHGIGSNCDSAPTTVYRTGDGGSHWTPLLHFTTTIGPPGSIRLFSQQVGLVAATVGPQKPTPNYHFTAALFRTDDGGRHWQRSSLPVNYATEAGTISFPDPQHGWLWYGGGAAGSMSVYVYRTIDGGRYWRRVACAAFSNPTSGYGCPHPSGIGLGGDKGYLTFKGVHDGWLTYLDNGGIPGVYRSSDGGESWHLQQVGLPPGVLPPTTVGKSVVYPFGTLLAPRFFGRVGLMPEGVEFSREKPRANWYRLYVFRSTDGGRTWAAALGTPVSSPIPLWQALDSRHWLFASTQAASQEAIWWTDNAGGAWTKYPLRLPAGLTLTGIQMIGRTRGWATAQTQAESEVSGSGTVLLRTPDSGRSWRLVHVATASRLEGARQSTPLPDDVNPTSGTVQQYTDPDSERGGRR